MGRYCAVYQCKSNSFDKELSFHKFPKDKKLQRVWTTRIKRDIRKDFRINKHTNICSKHFLKSDYIYPDSLRPRLKKGTCPTVFSWNKQKPSRKEPKERKFILPVKPIRAECENLHKVIYACVHKNCCKESKETQTDNNTNLKKPFSLSTLLNTNPKNQSKLLAHYTGFNCIDRLLTVLNFVLPDFYVGNLIYWYTGAKKRKQKDDLYGSDSDEILSSFCPDQQDTWRTAFRTRIRAPTNRKRLKAYDEFLLVLMKMRLGLYNLDIGVRFGMSETIISGIFISWINYLYFTLGSLKIWPHRDVIIQNMPQEFKNHYPNTMVIIDCTEIRIQRPSSLMYQSSSYSVYKGCNTLKCLIGCDPRGAIIFVSALYTGNISDKEICRRSGFMKLLQQKLRTGELLPGDAIMADKGFNIRQWLEAMNLQLNVPPVTQESSQLTGSEVIRGHTIAHHRIHIERAISKVKKFHIFSSQFPTCMMGLINQMWSVCCILTNFMDPIVNK